MVSISTLNTDNGKVSCETAEGTVINININQRSILDCLLDTIQALKTKTDQKRSGMDAKPSIVTTPAWSLGLGASMMSMGFVSVILAVIVCVVKPDMFLLYRGTLFWVGFPFMASGALNIVSSRHSNTFWEILVFISVLLSLSVSIAGLAMAVDEHYRLSWTNNYNSVCENLLTGKDRYNYGYGETRPPRNYYEPNWDLNRCKEGLQQYQTLLSALVIMIQLLMIWGLCLSILSLGCRLKPLFSYFYCCICKKPAEELNEPLLSPNPPGELLIV